MSWSQVENEFLERAKRVPYGFRTQLANELGLSRAYMGQIFKGDRPIPREHLDKLFAALGLEVVFRDTGEFV